jgi:glycosyltransferase involved in cell wall biosynthesis
LASADRAPVRDGSAGDLAVDVVVTNHNYGRFLAEALESACAQTHANVNVIVVDDGSTDDSREVLAAFADRVDVVLKQCGGQASALNAGFERCRGDAVILLDADDRLRPEVAGLVASALAADRELAKVQFGLEVIDATGAPTGAIRPPAGLNPPSGDQRRAELAFPFDLPWLPGGGTAFRASALRRILPIPEREYPRWGADWHLVHLSALLGTAGVLGETGAQYRVHGANGYEQERPDLDLDRVRDSIRYARATTRSLEDLADELELARPDRILSVADLANRLISLRLEPEAHPLAGDRRRNLLDDALRALRRRFDVSLPVKAVFAVWFLAEALIPRRPARSLATIFLFPERRSAVNPLLRRFRNRDSSA